MHRMSWCLDRAITAALQGINMHQLILYRQAPWAMFFGQSG